MPKAVIIIEYKAMTTKFSWGVLRAFVKRIRGVAPYGMDIDIRYDIQEDDELVTEYKDPLWDRAEKKAGVVR